MTRSTHIVIAAVLTCCAGGRGNAASPDPAVAQRLEEATQRRDELTKKFEANPADLREKCELAAGDCMIELRERRSGLLQANQERALACPPSKDADARLRCAVKQPARPDATGEAAKDMTPDVAEYYEDEVACLSELLKCTVSVKEQASLAVIEAKRQDRRSSVENADAAAGARNRVATIAEQIKYLRLTFPVRADEICPPGNEVAACVEQAGQQLAKWEPLVEKEEGADVQAAVAAYAAGKQAEAACHDPELKCLMAKLGDYGGTVETRQLVERNLSLIDERQRLTIRVKEPVVQRCVKDVRSQHQEQILDRFQAYVGQPKLYFRFQLERAFIALHTAQVDCLKKRVRRQPG